MAIQSVTTWDTEADVYGGRRPQPQWRLGQRRGRGQWRLGADGQLHFLPGILATAMPILNKMMGSKRPATRPVYIPPPKPPTPAYVYVLGFGGGAVLLGLLGYLALKK